MKNLNNTQEKIETEFLNLLFFNYEKVYSLLQIKPFYLLDSTNQKIFELMIKSFEETGVVSGSYIVNNLQNHELDKYANLISDNDFFVAPSNVVEYFMISQEILLERYKNKVQDDLINDFKLGKITREDLSRKTILIQEITFRKSKGKLTKEELLKPSKEKRIHLNSFSRLDEILNLSQGDFLIIGAKTGNGKTSLMLNLMIDLMEKYQCLYINMETSPQTIKNRIKSITADVAVKDVDSPRTDSQKERILKAIDKVDKCNIYLEHEITDLEDIEYYIKCQKGLDKRHTVVFLDHIGLIGLKGARNIYEKITFIAKRLRQICLKYDCTVISASQLSRTSYNSEELDISMLKDSGEIENSASKIIMLYRQKDCSTDCLEPEMILKIGKNRDGGLGEVSTIYYKIKQIFKEKGY